MKGRDTEMDKRYDVDDILAEIKRKKMQNAGTSGAPFYGEASDAASGMADRRDSASRIEELLNSSRTDAAKSTEADRQPAPSPARSVEAPPTEDFFSRQESGQADHIRDSGAPVYTSQDQSGPMSGRRIQFDDTLHEFFGANAVPSKKVSRREERQRARMGDTTLGLEREKLKKAKGKGSLDIVRGPEQDSAAAPASEEPSGHGALREALTKEPGFPRENSRTESSPRFVVRIPEDGESVPERIGSVPEAEGKALFSTAEKGEESNGGIYFDQPEGVDSTYEDYVRSREKKVTGFTLQQQLDEQEGSPIGAQPEVENIFTNLVTEAAKRPAGVSEDKPDAAQEEKPRGEERPSSNRTLLRRSHQEIAKEITSGLQGGEEPEETSSGIDEIDEYTEPSQKDSILRDIQGLKLNLWVRLVITLVLCGASLYLVLSASMELPMATVVSFQDNPVFFYVANAVVLCIAAILCNAVVGGGIIALFKGKSDNDTLPSLGVVAALIQSACLIFAPEDTAYGAVLFTPVVILGLVFNSIGKLHIVGRIERNFNSLSAPGDKHAVLLLKDRDMSRSMLGGLDVSNPKVCYGCKAGFLTNFLDLSYSEDLSESVSRILAPVVLIASLAVGAVSWFFHRDIFFSVTVLAGVLAIASPFASTIAASLPLNRLSAHMDRQGVLVSGYKAIDQYADAGAVMLDVASLFPNDSVTLHGIKTFQQGRIDEAIVDAASLVCSAQSTLKEVFLKVVAGQTALLKPVENIVYEDGMGLTGWVDGRRVLIGNRELMENHGVDVPSRDYEQRYIGSGHDVLYLANSGEVTALFVLTYNADPTVSEQLARLRDRGIALVVNSTDPNMNGQRIAKLFDYPSDLVRVMQTKQQEQYSRLSAPKETAGAMLAYDGSLNAFVRAVTGLIGTKKSIVASLLLEIVSVVIGIGLLSFFAFTKTLEQANALRIIIYQLFWTAAVVLMGIANRHS